MRPVSLLCAALLSTTFPIAANTADYQPPRMPDGKPDLQGVWTNVSLTTLIRGRQYNSSVLSKAEADLIEQQRTRRNERALDPTDPNAPPPSEGSNVGGYNSFWTDSGETLAKINGEYRTTWIVDPANGQLPYSEQGRKIFADKSAFTRNTFSDPEARPMAERCIVGFGSTGGPPMINVLYNNHYQIVQTPEAVMILVEMNHDARIIRIGDTHIPQYMDKWLGDSVGHWDGDTLIVETTHFNPGESLRLNFDQSFYLSPEAKVTEKFRRISANEILYQFTVDDPEVYTKPWQAEMVFNATKGNIYEYACHEGNVALPGILAGARLEEKES